MIAKLKRSRFLAALAGLSVGLTVVACGGGGESGGDSTGDSGTGPISTGETVAISGAGATFPAPLYQNWFSTYATDVNKDVQISYQSVGSGAGLEQYINGTVDFGASDAPIQGDRLASFKAKYNTDPIQVPMAGGAVVVAYNLPGVEGLKVSREVLCGIVEGKITNWNDPKIAADNAGLTLPDQRHRHRQGKGQG